MFYEIDGIFTTKEEYSQQLQLSGIVQSSMLCIDSKCVDKVTSLNETSRTAFIEFFCGAQKVIDDYKQLTTQIVGAKLDLEVSLKSHKELAVDKKKIKKDNETTDKRQQLAYDLEKHELQYDLFKMFHNGKFLETAGDVIETCKNNLDDVNMKKLESIKILKDCTDREQTLRKARRIAEINLETITDNFRDSHEKFTAAQTNLEFTQFELQGEDVESINNSYKEKLNLCRLEIDRYKELDAQLPKLQDEFEEYSQLKKSFKSNNSTDLLRLRSMNSIAGEDIAEYLKKNIDTYSVPVSQLEDKIDGLTAKIDDLKLKRDGKNVPVSKFEQVVTEADKAKLDFQIKCNQALLEEIELSYVYEKKKLENFKRELEELNSDPTRKGQRELVAKLQAEITDKESEHYKDFCARVDVATIEELNERFKIIPTSEQIQREIERLQDKIIDYETWIADNELSKLRVAVEKKEFERKNGSIDTLAKELAEKEEQMNNQAEENNQMEMNLLEAVKETAECEKTVEVLVNEISGIYEAMCDHINRIQKSLQQNYEVLVRNFWKHNTIELSHGTMMDFMIPPEVVPEDFQLVRDQLNLLEVNFKNLTRSLRENVDVGEKSKELKQKIRKLQTDVESISGKIGDDGYERIQRVSEVLKDLNRKISAQRAKVEEIDERLAELKDDRKEAFTECLKVINEGITDFCHSTLEGTIGKLEATNVDEPYLGDVAYIWQTIGSPEIRITELQLNHVSSLALLFGLLKFKKQHFVILDDATRKAEVNLRKLCSRGNIQVISFTRKLSYDETSYTVRPFAESYVIHRNR